jgi:hypothetical protein
VVQRLADQIRQHLPQPRGIAGHLQRAGAGPNLQCDRVIRARLPDGQCLGAVHHIAGECEQIHRPNLERALRVQAGQHQQILHQQAHPPGLGLDALEHLSRILARPLPIQLGEAADGRQGVRSS